MEKKLKKKKVQKIKDHVQRQVGAYKVASEKAKELSDDAKDEILDTILCELTAVVSNRIRLTQQVLDRQVPIKTTLPLEDGRTLTITLS